MGAVAAKYTSAPRPANWQPEYNPDEHPPVVEGLSDDGPVSESESSSDSSSDSDEEDEEVAMPERKKSITPQVEPTAYKPLKLNKKRKLSDAADEKVDAAGKAETEANPYFVVDTNPTVINLSTGAAAPTKKVKKKREPTSSSVSAEPKAKKVAPTPEPAAEVDFTAIEQQLQAEVTAGLAEQETKAANKAAKVERRSGRESVMGQLVRSWLWGRS